MGKTSILDTFVKFHLEHNNKKISNNKRRSTDENTLKVLVLLAHWQSCPVINLEEMSTSISYIHFKTESMHILTVVTIRRLNMQNRCLRWNQIKKKLPCFVEQKPLRVLCLWFGHGPAPLVFAKQINISISLMRTHNVRIVIIWTTCC